MGQYFSSLDSTTKLFNDGLLSGYQDFIRSPMLRQEFAKFVERGDWIEILSKHVSRTKSSYDGQDLDIETGSITSKRPSETELKQRLHQMSAQDISQFEIFSGKLFDRYLLPEGSCIFIDACFFNKRKSMTACWTNLFIETNRETKENEVVCKTVNHYEKHSDFIIQEAEMKPFLLACLFPIFFHEKLKRNYNLQTEFNNELRHPRKEYVESRTKESQSTHESNQYYRELGYSPYYLELEQTRLIDTMIHTLDSLSVNELDRTLSSGKWLINLLHYIEYLPVSIVLSTIPERNNILSESNHHGFHSNIIYANKAYEKLTLYTREEILGKSIDFIRFKKTERTQMELWHDAMNSNKSIKIGMTHCRKDGSEFFNLISMEPIINMNGSCPYLLTIQYDITSSEACSEHIKLIEDLLLLLPNVLRS